MAAPDFFISPLDLWALLGTAQAPQLVDVRRRSLYEAAAGLLPGAIWRDHQAVRDWIATLDRARPVVVTCKAGHELSQSVAAMLRAARMSARVLEGGYEGWILAGLPLINRAAIEKYAGQRPSRWVTRRRPKIDRIACPWLIRRFVDPDAQLLFIDPPEVMAVAAETGAIPFDVDGAELSHVGETCSFDTMLKLFGLDDDPALSRLALIVRGADTARFDLAPEAAGLLAVSLGLSVLAADDDHALLERGFAVYDALFAWARFAAAERHNWPVTAAKGAAA